MQHSKTGVDRWQHSSEDHKVDPTSSMLIRMLWSLCVSGFQSQKRKRSPYGWGVLRTCDHDRDQWRQWVTQLQNNKRDNNALLKWKCLAARNKMAATLRGKQLGSSSEYDAAFISHVFETVFATPRTPPLLCYSPPFSSSLLLLLLLLITDCSYRLTDCSHGLTDCSHRINDCS